MVNSYLLQDCMCSSISSMATTLVLFDIVISVAVLLLQGVPKTGHRPSGRLKLQQQGPCLAHCPLKE